MRHEFTEKGSPWQNGSLESLGGIIPKDLIAVLTTKHPLISSGMFRKYFVPKFGCMSLKKPKFVFILFQKIGVYQTRF